MRKFYVTYGKPVFILAVLIILAVSIILIPVCLNICKNLPAWSAIPALYPDGEVAGMVKYVIKTRSDAIVGKSRELLKKLYDTGTKYGSWAYEYELKKIKYIDRWEQKQGIRFVRIEPEIVVRSVRQSGDKISVNLLCSTEYKYVYEDKPDEINSFRIGTYHALDILKKEDGWVISKEWYKDPFADSMNLNGFAAESVKKYILSGNARDFSGISSRRKQAVKYAEQYCGAANDPEYGYKYNKKYRNYNSLGGDCANFASQILHEGGKFKKNRLWNYDSKGATRAWLNASGFKSYMLYSGRASLVAYGSYEKVYKASYKLLPGDFIAYEKKGDITHISVVTGADSRGYSLVSCHNTDRNKVPWDLGWSDAGIKFWLVRVHY